MFKLSKNKEKQYLSELFEFLKIPSVSADPKYNKSVNKAANWLSKSLSNSGCNNVEIINTDGHPIVYGEKIIDSKLPTILVYGHYDVQPPDPIELWDSSPFDPVIKKTDIHPQGAIFARGACDDKVQVYMHIKSLELMIAKNSLPCNVKFMIEGEEEIGSNNLEIFVSNNLDKLKADIILISDTGIINNKNPSITTALRGLSYMEIKVTGPNRDLHSGLYGGTVANPINVLCEIISKLKDSKGTVNIPGFYENVQILSIDEREKIAKVPFDKDLFKKSIGVKDTEGEIGFSTPERKSIRPTLDVNGIWGGYIGEGAKTVIPSIANAKISMRLVPNQNWKKISSIFENHIQNIAPKTVRVEITTHHGGQAYVTPTNNIGYKAAHLAYKKSFGKVPFAVRDGGSIPIVPMFEELLNCKTILMGFGLDSDAIHSPNEHFGLFNFFKGIETIPYFYHNYTKLYKEKYF
ncbi:MAG: peptidase dimerization domain protein [Flavobacteriaceae bacterium]|nr:peptidase dimerization domain protein [Flavobacteriaceae bacterium]